jgi:hypothetical protein
MSLLLSFWLSDIFLDSQFGPQMCFSLVDLVHKIINKRGTKDVSIILIHSGLIWQQVILPETKIMVCQKRNMLFKL